MSTGPVTQRKLSRSTLWLLVGGIVAALVAGAVGGVVAARWVAPSAGASCDTVRVAENVLPAVVTVFATGADGQGGTGSGAITTADGVIVTNDHVIHGLFVQQVTADGPAAQAGLRAGDVITTIAGKPASSLSLAWLLVSARWAIRSNWASSATGC